MGEALCMAALVPVTTAVLPAWACERGQQQWAALEEALAS